MKKYIQNINDIFFLRLHMCELMLQISGHQFGMTIQILSIKAVFELRYVIRLNVVKEFQKISLKNENYISQIQRKIHIKFRLNLVSNNKILLLFIVYEILNNQFRNIKIRTSQQYTALSNCNEKPADPAQYRSKRSLLFPAY